LIKNGCYVLDCRDDWSEHQPSSEVENRFIEQADLANTSVGTSDWTYHIRRGQGALQFCYAT
jgi:hypothetical protein